MAQNKFYKTSDITKDYKFQDLLGEGSFAKVWKATRKSDNLQVAIKSFSKKNLEMDEQAAIAQEVDILNYVDHPNIVKMYEVYDGPDQFHMVLELMTGGELFDRIVDRDHYSEQEAQEVIKPLADAISYCHKMGIVHRDLKPENILYSSPDEDAIVKISDFGLAKVVSNEVMITACGTPSYMAPEVLGGSGYNNQVDYWSIGVVLYVLLCGYPPFYEETNEKLFAQIKSGEVNFPEEDWAQISDSAKDLIRNLLRPDPNQRFDADKIKKHPWMQGEGVPNLNLERVTEKIKNYNAKKSIRVKHE